jgi:hypothetical protein
MILPKPEDWDSRVEVYQVWSFPLQEAGPTVGFGHGRPGRVAVFHEWQTLMDMHRHQARGRQSD